MNRLAAKQDMGAIEALVASEESVLMPAGERVQWMVAEESGEIVGCGAVVYESDEAVLASVVIRRDCRGRGLGGNLVTGMLLHLAKDLSISSVRVFTHYWQAFEASGFKATGRDVQRELAGTKVAELPTFPQLKEMAFVLDGGRTS